MNRFHCILLMVILSLADSVLASDSNSVAATELWNGYFDITDLVDEKGMDPKFYSRDSINGVYLHVEHSCDSLQYVDLYGTSHEYLKFYIGKNFANSRNDNVWVLTDSFDKDSVNSELKKGNPLTLEKFTKLDFDSSRVQYLVNSFKPLEVEVNAIVDSIKSTFYVLYQMDSVAALCGVNNRTCLYHIGCLYNKEGVLVFDSIPVPDELIHHSLGCIQCFETRSSLRQTNCEFDKQSNPLGKPYKVNGTSATKGSSNIIIQNKKQKIQLKGNKK